MRSFLFISYYFPPEPYAASVRAYHYVKNLKNFFKPYVLTKRISGVFIKDDSLLKDLDGIRIERVFDYISFIKSFIKLKGGAGREVKRILKPFYDRARSILEKERVDFIIITVPPFELLKVGVSLKKRFNLPLVCEIRDPADFESGKKFKRFIKKLENLVDFFVCSHEYVLKTFGINGYILEAGSIKFERKVHDGFNIVYTGTLKNAEESFFRFLEHTKNLDYNLYLLGPIIKVKDKRVIAPGYVNYDSLIKYFEISDLFVIFRDKDAKNYIPLKFFEYLGGDVPILAYFRESSNLFKYIRSLEKGEGFVWGEEKDMIKYLENLIKNPAIVKKVSRYWEDVCMDFLNLINEKIFNRYNC
ncbi:MAG: hypothetical protein ABDH49_03515 [Candidatus Hydrothermales bacterium]